MGSKSVSFEESVKRLDEIVKKMESGDVPLEEGLKLFEEGTRLVKSCSALLDKAELEVVKLMKSADGTPAEGKFEDEQPAE